MFLSDFDFKLPEKLIATEPVSPRDAAKLLVIDRKSGKTADSFFHHLPGYLSENDVLVFNNSRVIPARLRGAVRQSTIETLLIKETAGVWETKVKPGRKVKLGSIIIFKEGLRAEVVGKEEGICFLKFNQKQDAFWQTIEKIGEMPVPPYILKYRENTKTDKDKTDYQTVYAADRGSVAAPTAGLHFTRELLKKLTDMGVGIEFVDLHVGLGTFEPIRTEEYEKYKIHSEHYSLSPETAERLNKAKKAGKRIIAVGTTSVRVLETCQKDGILKAGSGDTDIYIYPGYKFGFVDAMITNFHLPKSSLLLLVSAFYNRERILSAYDYAIENNYRFYSYGDGMLII